MNTIDELKRQLLSLGMLYRNSYAEWPDFVILGKKERGIVEKYKLSNMTPSELAKGNLDGPKEILGFKIVDSAEHEYFAVSHCLLNEERYQAIKAQESAGNDLFEGENQVKFLGLPLVKLSTNQGPRYGVVLHNTDRNPTIDAYSEINAAFDHFNKHLFGGELPKCLITFQREKNTMGYLSSKRFTNKSGEKIDELAMNPAYFGIIPIQETMKVLVHEMTHLWQVSFGKASRSGYHNSEYAQKLEDIGLMPSDNGRPGGKRVGQRMSEYVIENGPFQKACNDLLSTEFSLSWYDRFAPITVEEAVNITFLEEQIPSDMAEITPKARMSEREIDTDLFVFKPSPNPVHYEDDESGEPQPIKPRNSSNRSKYQCPNCKGNMWGAPGKRLLCDEENCEKIAYEEIG